jgi:two-component sensor histidine kinase
VSDNGVGLPEGFNIARCDSLGVRLVEALTYQINGSLKMESENGTHCLVEFPLAE